MAQPVTEGDIRRIYHATIDGLYRYVSTRCGGERELAEDVVQETWLRAVRSWRTLPDEPAAWLTTVARNLLVSHYRRRRTEPLDEALLATLVAEEATAHGDRDALLQRALRRLPRPAARLLAAFHLDRRRVAEIADTEGMSARAVEGRLRRARQQLKRQITIESESEGEHE